MVRQQEREREREREKRGKPGWVPFFIPRLLDITYTAWTVRPVQKNHVTLDGPLNLTTSLGNLLLYLGRTCGRLTRPRASLVPVPCVPAAARGRPPVPYWEPPSDPVTLVTLGRCASNPFAADYSLQWTDQIKEVASLIHGGRKSKQS